MHKRKNVIWSSSFRIDRYGLHASNRNKHLMQAAIRRVRREAKKLLRREDFDGAESIVISAGYFA